MGPLSDPYRPRTDFNALVHDYEDKDTIIGAANAPFPRPVLVESFDEVFNTPLTYNYNLTFEREVTTGWMARAAYVGSTATQGRASISLNPAIYTPGGPAGNPQARRRFPEYSGINNFVQDRESQYHSMQLTLNRRYANGFTVNSNYTLSDLQGPSADRKWCRTSTLTWRTSSTRCGTGASTDMRRHRFVTSWVYDIPGPTAGALSHAIGGWQVTGIYPVAERQPYTDHQRRGQRRLGIGNESSGACQTGAAVEPPAGSDQTVWFNAGGVRRQSRSGRSVRRRGRVLWSEPLNRRYGAVQAVPLLARTEPAVPGGVLQPLQPGELQQPEHHGEPAATFGRITEAQDPRIMQFGLKFPF